MQIFLTSDWLKAVNFPGNNRAKAWNNSWGLVEKTKEIQTSQSDGSSCNINKTAFLSWNRSSQKTKWLQNNKNPRLTSLKSVEKVKDYNKRHCHLLDIYKCQLTSNLPKKTGIHDRQSNILSYWLFFIS